MNYDAIKESLESVYPCICTSSVVEYLETCVCENKDINGPGALKFDSLKDLVLTYLDEIKICKRDFDNIMFEAKNNKIIMSLVRG